MTYVDNGPWEGVLVTTGESEGEFRLVLCDPEDVPMVFLDKESALTLARAILWAVAS